MFCNGGGVWVEGKAVKSHFQKETLIFLTIKFVCMLLPFLNVYFSFFAVYVGQKLARSCCFYIPTLNNNLSYLSYHQHIYDWFKLAEFCSIFNSQYA